MYHKHIYFYRCYWDIIFYDEGMLLFMIISPPCNMPSTRKEFLSKIHIELPNHGDAKMEISKSTSI